jgi:four helix bundle suffix protein
MNNVKFLIGSFNESKRSQHHEAAAATAGRLTEKDNMENGKNMEKHGPPQPGDESLIPKHSGYRRLKTFQLSEIIYDITVRFCDKYIDRRSRTRDQMTQAARSGRQNIAEGSVDSATSKKIELKLTGIAKGSLEELRLDYEDYLRQRDLPRFEPNHPVLVRFKARRCASVEQFRLWVADEMKLFGQNTDINGRAPKSEKSKISYSASQWTSVLVANGALSLLNLCIYLLDRQMKAQAQAFEQEGGFTERMYRIRSEARKRKQ